MSTQPTHRTAAHAGAAVSQRAGNRALRIAGVLLGILLSGKPLQASEINYLVIEDQVEPYQISHPGQPLAGGLITDVVQRVFAGSEFQLKPVTAPWLRLAAMIRRKEIANWLVYGWQPAEMPGAECSATAIAEWRSVLVLPKQSLPVPAIKISDLHSKHLVLVRGYDYPGLDEYLVSRGNQPIVDERTQTPESALRMLRHGRADAYVEESFRLQYLMKKLSIPPGQFTLIDMSNIIPTKSVCLMYDEALPSTTKQWLNKRLRELARSGELAAIRKRYQ